MIFSGFHIVDVAYRISVEKVLLSKVHARKELR